MEPTALIARPDGRPIAMRETSSIYGSDLEKHKLSDENLSQSTEIIETTSDQNIAAAPSHGSGPVKVDDVPCPPESKDPFGHDPGTSAKYKSLSWWQCGLLLIAETVSLGILSLPLVVATVGFVPGILLIVGIGALSTYTGFTLGQLRQKFPHLHSFADAGALVMGRPGRIIIEIAQLLFFVFVMAAHVLTFSIMMNVLTNHGACTIVFAAVGTVISVICTLPRTLKNMSYLSAFSCLSILMAVIVTIIGVGIKSPAGIHTFAIVPSNMTALQRAVVGVADIVIAYTGHVTFLGFMAELKQPRDFTKALVLLETVAITLYVVVAAVIYSFAGEFVKSPALTSASPVFRKAAYGIAFPTIIVAGVINAHVCVKNIYVRIFRATPAKLHQRTLQSYGTWVLLCATLWALAFIIAEAIPVFNQLLGLIGSLFCTWFSLGLPAIFWLWMHKAKIVGSKQRPGEPAVPKSREWRFWTLVLLNTFVLIVTIAICGLGTYGSVVGIADHAHEGGVFSCKDNSA